MASTPATFSVPARRPAAAHKIAFAQAVERQLAHPLGRVAMERDSMPATEFRHLAPGLQDPGFVISRHHPDKGRGRSSEFLGQPGKFHQTLSIHRDKPATFRKPMGGSRSHRRMFHRRNPRAERPLGRPQVMNGAIIGFGGARGPNDFVRLASQPGGQLLAGLAQRPIRTASQAMRTGGISWIASHRVQPRFPCALRKGRSRVMVKVVHLRARRRGTALDSHSSQ
jgi:hypothetical protein